MSRAGEKFDAFVDLARAEAKRIADALPVTPERLRAAWEGGGARPGAYANFSPADAPLFRGRLRVRRPVTHLLVTEPGRYNVRARSGDGPCEVRVDGRLVAAEQAPAGTPTEAGWIGELAPGQMVEMRPSGWYGRIA